MVDCHGPGAIALNALLADWNLAFKAVRVWAVDENGTKYPASGFLMQEPEGLYLYTCWHVVTGLGSPAEIAIKSGFSYRRKLIVEMISTRPSEHTSATLFGDVQSFELSLLAGQAPPKPQWLQENLYVPNEELERAGFKVPLNLDLVKIKMDPAVVRNPELYMVPPNFTRLELGDSVLVVGYPYGYSVGGKNLIPVVLTRHVAATLVGGFGFILDGPGAEGMSGGPVFVRKGGSIALAGIYTGGRYPDAAVHGDGRRNPATALGTATLVSPAYQGLPFSKDPDAKVFEPHGRAVPQLWS